VHGFIDSGSVNVGLSTQRDHLLMPSKESPKGKAWKMTSWLLETQWCDICDGRLGASESRAQIKRGGQTSESTKPAL
jgi:hypothetical protein